MEDYNMDIIWSLFVVALVFLLPCCFFVFSAVHLYKKIQTQPDNYHNQAFLCALWLSLIISLLILFLS